jgi:hypothetical protein
VITTLFEMTTQHGWVSQVLHSIFQIEKRHARHYEIQFISVKPSDIRYMRVFYKPALNAEVPIFTYRIPERSQMESTQMWRRNVEKELVALWKEHFGAGTKVTLESPVSSPPASSTDVPPASETSPSEPIQAEPESTESAPLPPSEPQSKPSVASSKASRPRSKRKAKSSLS